MPRLALSALLLLIAFSPSCRNDPADKARLRLHNSGYAFSVDDFLRAASDGRESILRDFITAGMRPDVTDASGTSAVSRASSAGHGHLVTLLINQGAAPAVSGPKGGPILLAAAASGDLDAVSALIRAGADPAWLDPDGWSALATAAQHGHAPIIAALAPIAPNQLDRALKIAALEGHTAAIAALLDAGADPIAPASDGRSALMFAAEHGRNDAATLLLLRGAIPTALDLQSLSAADHADQNGHDALAITLRQAAPPLPANSLPSPPPPTQPWPGLPASSLAAAAAQFSSITISPRSWPFALSSVAPDNSSAAFLFADSPEPLTFSSGDPVGTSGWIIDSITHRLVPLRPNSTHRSDLSEVRLRRDDNPNRLLAVRGCLVQSPEWSATIRIGNHPDPLSLHSGDQFDAGGIPVRIAAILPSALILANSATSEQLSVPATR